MSSFKERAQALDRSDSLAGFRDRFFFADEDIIYLDGNSLGRMPADTEATITALLTQQWGSRLIRSWNEHWMDFPGRIGSKLARLLGCSENEIFIGDSTSMNLYKLAFAALHMHSDRHVIVTDSLNFPTDLYILQGLIDRQFPGHSLRIAESSNDISMSLDELDRSLDTDTALLCLSHVAFKSAHLYDMQAVTDLARSRGIPVLWDLSHSAGSVPIDLNRCNADMAVGCTYKYLNGGPGAPAYLYVRQDLQKRMNSPVWGWFGHARPFDFSPDYEPAPSAQKFAAGTPHILSMAPVETGVDLLLEAGMDALREKSMAQTSFVTDMFGSLLEPLGFSLGSPDNAADRGSHVSLRHQEGLRINKAMIGPRDNARPVIPDFRPPNIIRLGIAPLYTSFTDLYDAVIRMYDIVDRKLYSEYDAHARGVT